MIMSCVMRDEAALLVGNVRVNPGGCLNQTSSPEAQTKLEDRSEEKIGFGGPMSQAEEEDERYRGPQEGGGCWAFERKCREHCEYKKRVDVVAGEEE